MTVFDSKAENNLALTASQRTETVKKSLNINTKAMPEHLKRRNQ